MIVLGIAAAILLLLGGPCPPKPVPAGQPATTDGTKQQGKLGG